MARLRVSDRARRLLGAGVIVVVFAAGVIVGRTTEDEQHGRWIKRDLPVMDHQGGANGDQEEDGG